MADLGKAYVQIVPSAKGISGAIESVLDPESKSAGMTAGGNIASELTGKLKTALVGLGIGKIISDSISSGMEFESSMTKASTLFSGTTEEFQGLQAEILSISKETGVAASQLAEAAYSAESASAPMQNLGSMIEASSKLATAGFTDIDTALSATAKTMNSYGMVTDDAAETQANMEKVQRILIQTQNKGITTVGELGASLAQVTPTAAAFGVGFDQIGASLAGMTAQGTSTAQATTQLNSLIAELGKDGTTASDHFRELTEYIQEGGLSFAEAMERGWDLSDVLSIMDEGAAEAGVSMVDMFSSIEAGKAALSIWNSDWAGNMEAMATEADVVGDAYSRMADTTEFKINKFKNALKNTGIEAFAAVAEPLGGFLEGVLEVFDRLTPSTDALGGSFSNLMGSFGQYIGDLLGLEEGFSGVDVAVAVLQPVIDGLSQGFDFLSQHMDIVVPVLSGLTAGFVAFQAGSGIMTMAGTIGGVVSKVSGLAAAAGGLIPMITGLVSPFGIAVVAIGGLVAAGVVLYKNWDTIKAKAQEISGNISEKWNTIKNNVTKTAEGLRENVTSKFDAIRSGIKEKIESARDTVENAIEKIKGFFKFEWSLPHLKLPHPYITGKFSLNPPEVPHFGIDWYAKGGIIDGASIIGVGEAGPEAVVPLSGQNMLPFARAIAEGLQNDTEYSQVRDILAAILQFLRDNYDGEPVPIVLDSGALVGYSDRQLGVRAGMKKRGVI